jgi:sugar (pentulose or hexulose) kinase
MSWNAASACSIHLQTSREGWAVVLPTITIDIGTTSVKLCLFGSNADLITSARHPTPTASDGTGQIYDLPTLLGHVKQFIQDLRSPVRALVQRIAITGVGESGGLVRPDLSLASPMILWHDQRGVGYLTRLTTKERRLIYRVTGLPVSGNYGLSKTAWAVEHTDGAAADSKWLNIAEYLAALMSGERWSEPSLASRTMALDLSRGIWSTDVCGLVGVDVSIFPELRPAAEGLPITTAFAEEVGLDAGVDVHVAGHDHMVGAVGAGLQPGELLNSTGTTEGLLFLHDAPSLDEGAERSKLANGLACAGTDYTLFASIPTGGSAFATLQQMLGVDAGQLTACLSNIHERYINNHIDLGAAPLVLPQFRGSAPPTKSPSARGLISGLSTDTRMEDIIFGCFLGMTLQFCDVLELFRVSTERVKVIGPASGNPLWVQLKADMLGKPLAASRFPEVVSRGAQALASGVAGAWEETEPHEVDVDPTRHAHLTEWRTDVRPRWEHLKGFPS